jgi:hypothetical protein
MVKVTQSLPYFCQESSALGSEMLHPNLTQTQPMPGTVDYPIEVR